MPEEEWVAAVGKPGRVVAARIERGKDTINSIIELIEKNGFKSGTVTGIGSLNSATFIWGRKPDMTLPPEESFITYTMKGPLELGIGWGMFGTGADGSIFLHFHAIIMDKELNMRCGNLQPGSAPVMVTLDIKIQELLDLEIKTTLDPIIEAKLLSPTNIL